MPVELNDRRVVVVPIHFNDNQPPAPATARALVFYARRRRWTVQEIIEGKAFIEIEYRPAVGRWKYLKDTLQVIWIWHREHNSAFRGMRGLMRQHKAERRLRKVNYDTPRRDRSVATPDR